MSPPGGLVITLGLCGNPKLKPWFAMIASCMVSRSNGICELDKTGNMATLHIRQSMLLLVIFRVLEEVMFFFLVCWSTRGGISVETTAPKQTTQLRRSQVWQSAIKLKALVNRWSDILSSIEWWVWSQTKPQMVQYMDYRDYPFQGLALIKGQI